MGASWIHICANIPAGWRFLALPHSALYFHIQLFVGWEGSPPSLRWLVHINVNVALQQHIWGNTHRIMHWFISVRISSTVPTSCQPLSSSPHSPVASCETSAGMLNRSRSCIFIGSVAETRLNYTCIWRLLSMCAKRETETKQQRSGVPCRISCQLHRPRICRLWSLVLSVNFTCWISMRLCLSPPTTQPARSIWLQSQLQPSRIKHASLSPRGSEFHISNQQ